MRTTEDDPLVSFDVVSLFTKIPTTEALEIINEKYAPSEDTIRLARHCMSSTYFIYKGQFYKQVEGAPMGSPLSPVVANLFMEDFETKALETADFKPQCWLRYVDDTFVIWRHGLQQLQEFHKHLNSIHPKIQFTMEIEKDNKLAFLDVLVYKKSNHTLGHTVFRKTTHTNRYLNAASHHHPSQIQSVANTLAVRSRRIADEDNIKEETKILHEALLKNGYPNRMIHKACNLQPKPANTEEAEKPIGYAYLPYIKGTTDRISKVLARENIKTVFTTDKKIGELLRPSKDTVYLEGHGVYEIPCGDCSQTYIGQTGRNMHTRLREHELAVEQNKPKSALAQHAHQNQHNINFGAMRALAIVQHLVPRTIREAIEIERRPHNLNVRDDSKSLPTAWKPTVATITVKPSEPDTSARKAAADPPTRIDKRKTKTETNDVRPGVTTRSQSQAASQILTGAVTRSRARTARATNQTTTNQMTTAHMPRTGYK